MAAWSGRDEGIARRGCGATRAVTSSSLRLAPAIGSRRLHTINAAPHVRIHLTFPLTACLAPPSITTTSNVSSSKERLIIKSTRSSRVCKFKPAITPEEHVGSDRGQQGLR